MSMDSARVLVFCKFKAARDVGHGRNWKFCTENSFCFREKEMIFVQ